MNSEVITVATHEEGLLKELINNNFNIKIRVLGFGEKWTGFKMKFELVYNYIKNLPNNKIIIFLDGFDSTINGSLDKAINRFLKKKSKVIFSKDVYSPFYGLEKIVFPTCRNNIIINSGMYMGYVKYLKILLHELLTKKCKDDQVIVNRLCKKYEFINIDNNEDIFKNVYNTRNLNNEMKKSNAIFFSQPGTLSFKRVKRAIIEYSQFFIPYILLLYIIMMYLYYKSKKIYHIITITIILIIFLIIIEKSCII